MKKEYYIPLAIIISTIIIGISIYLGTTLEYREKKAYCEKFMKEITPKVTKKEAKEAGTLFNEMQLRKCIKMQ